MLSRSNKGLQPTTSKLDRVENKNPPSFTGSQTTITTYGSCPTLKIIPSAYAYILKSSKEPLTFFPKYKPTTEAISRDSRVFKWVMERKKSPLQHEFKIQERLRDYLKSDDMMVPPNNRSK